jgi:hypothetical protein
VIKDNKQLTILNLTGQLTSELSYYFSSRNVIVIEPLISSEIPAWTHVITKDLHDFTHLNKKFEITRKNKKIISLTQVDDLQNFAANNGDIILDDCWFKGSMGPFILDKYFQDFTLTIPSNSYPVFKELGSFNIVNPFNTGEYLDRVIQKAFEHGTDALTVKTYFDHLVMYAAGLKTKGKAGLPFEVIFGTFEDIFAIQIHFFSDKIELMDVITSLNSQNSKKAEEYYLNTAVKSSDFFDFSFVPDTNKVIITSLWTQDKRVRFENRGVMFSSIRGGVPLVQYYDQEAKPFLIEILGPGDFSDKVVIPGHIAEAVAESLIKGLESSTGSSTLVNGKFGSEEAATTVRGFSETQDEVKLIKSDELLKQIAQTIKGKFDQDKTVLKISGGQLDVDKFAQKIASHVDETNRERDFKVRPLVDQLPPSIKSGLFNFAKDLGKTFDELNQNDIDNFQVKKLPEVIKNELVRLNLPDGGVENELLELKSQLRASGVENESLKIQIKKLFIEMNILKESRNKLSDVQKEADQLISEAKFKLTEDLDSDMREHYQTKLKEQKYLDGADSEKLAQLLHRESKLINDLKEQELKSKKLEVELSHKEAFFTQELLRAERKIKAKDLFALQAKQAYTKLVEKKDREASDLRGKIDQLNNLIAKSSGHANAVLVRDLEKQNLNLIKQIDFLKEKLSNMSLKIEDAKTEAPDSRSEARKLQLINQQLKNKLEAVFKDKEKIHSKLVEDTNLITSLRANIIKLEMQLSQTQNHGEDLTGPTHKIVSDQEVKTINIHNQILENQVKDYTAKISILEARLAELNKGAKNTGLSGSGDDASKVKVGQLEASVKKLTQDTTDLKNQLGESKKEANKLRQEKTALQNQLDKIKKDAEKQGKKGGKAA